MQNRHLTVQRTLFKDTSIDAAHVGNKGARLPIPGDLNQARPITAYGLSRGLTTLGTLPARRPFQGFNDITPVQPTGFSNYHGMQLKFEHCGRDPTLLSAFTWAKAIDTVGQVLETPNGGISNPQDVRSPMNDKGASSCDRGFNSTTSVVYQMPFAGRGAGSASSCRARWRRWLADGKAPAMVSFLSGQPLNIRNPDAAGIVSGGQPDFPGNVALRPNYGGGD